MNTIQALQALYVKLGGSLTDTYANIADGAAVGNYTTIPDMIQACTQKAGSGGGSALPAVTAADNGKMLTVVGGDWDKADAPSVTVDTEITEGGTNPVTGGAIYTALSGKQATLNFDNAPTEDSDNPVKSGGVYTALAGKADKVESPLKLTGELGEDAEERPTLTITDNYTMHDIYTEVNSGRLVYVDIELGENVKLRAQSSGCYYIPANGGNEAQYSVTFNGITAEDEQSSIVIRFYSASFTNSNTALVVEKTLTAS